MSPVERVTQGSFSAVKVRNRGVTKVNDTMQNDDVPTTTGALLNKLSEVRHFLCGDAMRRSIHRGGSQRAKL